AIDLAQSMTSDYGETEILGILKWVFENSRDDMTTSNLVESVARAGKVNAQFVTHNDKMDKKVIGMLKNSLKPPIIDYKITWNQPKRKLLRWWKIKPNINLYSDKMESPPSPPTFFRSRTTEPQLEPKPGPPKVPEPEVTCASPDDPGCKLHRE
ncbi:13194_t:CDS:2, partial [Funneliformis mosseae]